MVSYRVWFEQNQFFDLDPHTFDQSQHGWRSLSTIQQQKDVLQKYINLHVKNDQFLPSAPKGVKELDVKVLYWHLGQIYAMLNQNNLGVHYMNKSLSDDDQEWNRYVFATIAFLNKDKVSFEKMLNQKNYNIDTLNRLHSNFNKSYQDAY